MNVLLDECFAPDVADRLGELLPPEWRCNSVYLVGLDGTYNGALHELAKDAGLRCSGDEGLQHEARDASPDSGADRSDAVCRCEPCDEVR